MLALSTNPLVMRNDKMLHTLGVRGNLQFLFYCHIVASQPEGILINESISHFESFFHLRNPKHIMQIHLPYKLWKNEN